MRKLSEDYILHIGTTRIAFLKAGKSRNGTPEVLSYSVRPSSGFERGVVKDLGKSAETLQACMQDVTHKRRTSVSCRAVVSNGYLNNFTFSSSLYFYGSPHVLTLRDVQHVIAQTRSVATIPLNEMIIQVVPQEFLVDDMSGIMNPIGLEASRLGVTLRLFTIDYAVYRNLQRALERADIEAVELIPVSLTAAHAVLSPDEKRQSVILVDVGGHATHIDCYQNSTLVESRSILFGSEFLTAAIAKKLNIKSGEARRLKESAGSALTKPAFSDELLPFQNDRDEIKHMMAHDFYAQMSGFIQKFMSTLAKPIRALAEERAPVTSVVFTGGGAKLDGFLEAIQEYLPYSLSLGTVRNMLGPQALIADASFAGALGAIDYTGMTIDADNRPDSIQNPVSRAWEIARRWVVEYF